MRLAVLLCIGALSALPCSAQPLPPTAEDLPALPLTERDAVSRFLAGDPRIRALEARIDQVRSAQAERTLWPNPSATYSRESVQSSHDTFLVARQELPISGRRGALQTAGRRAVEAAQAEAQFERTQLLSELRVAYAALLLAQQRVGALDEAIDELEQLVAVLRTREEGGEGSTYDRMRGQRALLDLQAERALTAGTRALAQGRLAAFLGPGVRPETLVAVETVAPETSGASLPGLIEEALANRGDLTTSEIAIARFDAERDAATRLQVPTPTITGGLKRSDLGGTISSGYQLSVDVSLPLFSRGQAATSLARAQRAEAMAAAALARIRIEAEVRAAYELAAIHAERAARYREGAAAIAAPLAEIGRVGYEEGELGILELLDAERQAVDARLQALELTAAARRAAIDLDRVIGREIRP